MAILTKTGKLIGQITSPLTKNIELRIEQYKKFWDEKFKLTLAKTIVAGKIINSLNLIRNFSYNHPEIALEKEIEIIQNSVNTIINVDNLTSLMGIEGSSARIYFEGYGKMILGEFVFPRRKKHPSTDPVNALLSFGYTIVFNEISSLLDGLGFDPYLGYYHKIEYGRASLASDILEEFRSSIDRFTLYLINNRIFKKEDFFINPKGEGLYLTRDSLKRYFVEYEKVINHEFHHPETGEIATLRKSFRIQAEKLGKYIKNGNEYTTFKNEL
jgi:CRISPR-associated protein Cas1